MKGFGFRQEKQAIAQAIQKRHVKQAEKLLAQLEQRLSVQDVTELFMEVLATLSPADVDWASEHLLPDEMYAEIDEQVTMMLYQALTSKGFKPGRDFSFSQAGIVVSQQAHDAILLDVPEAHRDVFSSELVKIQAESPIEVLERQLGVPFIDNLLQRIDRRLPTLSDRQASMYLYNIATGVENRTGIPMMEILIGHFEENQQFSRVFELIQQGKSAENSDWVSDLVTSAGGEAELHPNLNDPSDYTLSDRGLALLDRVYLGKRSISPLLNNPSELD